MAGAGLLLVGAILTAIRGTGYLMNKLAKNARRSSKKDFLVQSKK